jgi:polyhydroxybutyrate depolymerase
LRGFPFAFLPSTKKLSLILFGLTLTDVACDRSEKSEPVERQPEHVAEEHDAAANESDNPFVSLTPGAWTPNKLMVGTKEREFLAFLPDADNAAASARFVLFAHGYGATAESLKDGLPIEQWANDHGFTAILPKALENPREADGGRTSWNAEVCCAFGDTERDDLAFFGSLVEDLRDVHSDKVAQIYLIGFSNGGFLAEHLGCRQPGWFDGVSSIGGSSSVDNDTCETDSDLRVHRVTGAADERIKASGGETPLGTYRSFDDDWSQWSSHLQCEEPEETEDYAVSCRTSACERGAVRFCLVEGLRHQWPTKRGFAFDAFEDAWAFWQQE